MHDRHSEEVRRLLKDLGFAVTPVPETKKEKRPDLLAMHGEVRMFVEVKARELDTVLQAGMYAVPLGADEQQILTPLGKQNGLSADVKDANDQLAALAAADDLRLLWFRAHDGLFVHGAGDQVVATLLGIRAVGLIRAGTKLGVRCPFAGLSDFYRCRDIDGAIVENEDGLLLLPNPYSARYEAFLGSHVCTAFPAAAIYDGSKARYAVLGDAVDRRSDDSVLSYLRQKFPEETIIEFLPEHAGTKVTVIDAAAMRPAKEEAGEGAAPGKEAAG